MGQQALELLAPAKNHELGMAAINHGADAVYIGAEQFGARAAAGNSIAEIGQLCTYARRYRARVYVALNTLIFDHELEAARDLIYKIWDAGADALIIQDMGLLEMDLPPIPLFASTQTDNQTPEKVRFLEQSGFQRVILARELGLDAIARIRKSTSVDLEAFVHGALCVCYSGRCYMSAAIGGRSANRGACGQPCRLPWNLVTEAGEVLAENRFLLSLKDMNRSDHLAALAGAGITSFKIEGRLKDLAYVKNITGFYRRRLDALLEGNPGFTKASSGKTVLSFTPDPAKTFNRGETDYFLFGREGGPVDSPDTPKSMGEKIGTIKKVTPDWLTLDTRHRLNNGDGLCFLDAGGRLRGFQVNRVDKAGKLFPPGRQPLKKMPVSPGMTVYRNHDQAFSRLMAGKTSDRRIGLDLVFSEVQDGFLLSSEDEDNTCAQVKMESPKEPARNKERALGVIETQLGKLGNSLFFLRSLSIESAPYFLSAKDLNRLRRDLVSALEVKRERQYVQMASVRNTAPVPYPESSLDFRANVANALARKFYEKRGVAPVEPAFEISPVKPDGPVMTTKHCIRHSMGQCPKRHKPKDNRAWSGPLYLENEKGRFRVVVDCRRCEMQIR
ncbi:MAG: U32 family peptidase [Desulfobacterales bacterium]|nr:U32 family peptidase [Desulfobacterales bacterium]